MNKSSRWGFGMGGKSVMELQRHHVVDEDIGYEDSEEGK